VAVDTAGVIPAKVWTAAGVIPTETPIETPAAASM
jgi:hypothetical protein